MSSKRSQHLLEIFNIKYFVLLAPFVIFLLLSSVFTGYAAPIQSEADFVEVEGVNGAIVDGASVAKSTPDAAFYGSRLRQTSLATETLYASGAINVNQVIPDANPDGAASQFEMDLAMMLTQVELIVDIQHPALSDLQMVLTSPAGKETIWSGEQIQQAQLENGFFRFLTANYEGDAAQGPWQLKIIDTESGEEGTFVAWNLVLRSRKYFVFLPTILKPPDYKYTPEGIMMLVAYILPPSLQSNLQESVSAQVTLTPPNPTLDPGVTPVPTTGPGTPTYTPSPKATLTPTATSTPEFGLIPDGDFENDPTSWRTFSLKGYPIIFDDNSNSLPESPYPAFSDSHLVWLGGDDSELSYIEKEVFIEPGRPFLTHKFAIYSVDPVCASDLFSDFTVATQFESGSASTLNNLQSDVGGLILYQNGVPIAVYALDLCAEETAGAWSEIVYNTAPFVGRTVTIRFKTIGDSQATSGFFIDDVGLRGDIPSNFIPFLKAPNSSLVEPTFLATTEPNKDIPIPESFRKAP